MCPEAEERRCRNPLPANLPARNSSSRRRACRANLEKAWARDRTPGARTRSRFNALKHGLNMRTLEATMRQLGEDPKEFAAHEQRFRRVFAPANRAEEKVVHLLAAATWRRLRLFRAQARWESDRLKHFLSQAAEVERLDAETTRQRGLFLLIALTERDRFNHRDQSLIALVEREIRMLLRLRSPDDPGFSLFSRASSKEGQRFQGYIDEVEEEYREIAEEEKRIAFLERLREGGPEVEAALERARANLLSRSESKIPDS